MDALVAKHNNLVLGPFFAECNRALGQFRQTALSLLNNTDEREFTDFLNNARDAWQHSLESAVRKYESMHQMAAEEFERFVSNSGKEAPPPAQYAMTELFGAMREIAERKGDALFSAAYAREPLFAVDPVPLGSYVLTNDRYCISIVQVAPVPQALPQVVMPQLVPFQPPHVSGSFAHVVQEFRNAFLGPFLAGANKLLADQRAAAIWIVANVTDAQELTQRADIAEQTFRCGFEALQRRYEGLRNSIVSKLDHIEGEVPPYVNWVMRDYHGQILDYAQRKSSALRHQTTTRAIIASTDALPLGSFSAQTLDYTNRYVTGY